MPIKPLIGYGKSIKLQNTDIFFGILKERVFRAELIRQWVKQRTATPS